MPKKTINEEINAFLDCLTGKDFIGFMRQVLPIMELYHVDDTDLQFNSLEEAEDERVTTLVQTAYLMSKIADRYAGKLCQLSCRFPKLWARMEKEVYCQTCSNEKIACVCMGEEEEP